MNAILNFVRDYFIFMLILFLFSYLAPREDYRKYLQFFIGALMVVILMRPVLKLFSEDGEEKLGEELAGIREDMERIEYGGEGEDIFDWLSEYEGVDTEEITEP